MPRMTGFDVLKRLKDDPKTAHIPIILLTAKDQDVDVFSRFHPGYHCCIGKPYDPLGVIRALDGLEPQPA